MPKFLLPLLLCLSVLAGHAVAAENADTPPAGQLNWGSCFVAPPPPLDMPDSDVPDGEYEVFSGQAKFDRSGNILFDDKISLVSGKKMLRADSAEYDSVAGVFEVEGQVEFRDPETRVRASRAEYNQQTQEIEFQNATFELWSVPARGESSFIKAGGDGKLRLNDVSYTTCPEGNDDWYIRAKKIRIDRNKGIGTAQHARLNFKGVPVLYFPYISYPVSDQRKTGWLIPKLGTSQQRGVDISAPFYWNIAPQYDATLTPRFMSKRGGQLATEFRYLSSNSDGVLTTEWMPNDDETDQHRALVSLDHTTNFTSELRGRIDAIQVSDGQYFEDLSSGLQATSQTNLRRYADLEFFNDVWSTTLRFEDYQTLDDAIIDEDEPYTMLPRLTVNGYDANGPLGLRYQLDGELTYFYRDVGVTGIRGNVLPEVSFKKRLYFFDIEPSFAFDYTGYKLDDTAAGADTTPNRTAPIYSVDATSVFERITKKRGWLQTLEPRAFYTYI
ncbi:MAG: LPS assembly protein LptD, partial [Gammaproteobacteria bacterium]|nr:LPS assembly protein LptD [Gammaproteobacteria bacterium]